MRRIVYYNLYSTILVKGRDRERPARPNTSIIYSTITTMSSIDFFEPCKDFVSLAMNFRAQSGSYSPWRPVNRSKTDKWHGLFNRPLYSSRRPSRKSSWLSLMIDDWWLMIDDWGQRHKKNRESSQAKNTILGHLYSQFVKNKILKENSTRLESNRRETNRNHNRQSQPYCTYLIVRHVRIDSRGSCQPKRIRSRQHRATRRCRK